MTSRDRRAGPQRREGVYRVAFLILAVVPLALVVPLVAAHPFLGSVALVSGSGLGVALLASSPARCDGSRRVTLTRGGRHGAVTLPPGAADRTQEYAHVPDRRGALLPAHAQGKHAPGGRAALPSGGHQEAARLPPAGAPPRVEGEPTLHYRSADPVGNPPIGRREQCQMTVIEPPVLEGGTRAGRSAWRLPAGQVQSGIAADAGQLGDLEVRAASVIGPGHRCEDPATPRQDAYAIMRTSSGTHLIVAVADGLSSSANSEIGARVAVTAAARSVHRALDATPDPERLAADELFRQVAGEMVGTGRSRDLDDRDLCSVLIVAVIPAVAQPDGFRRVWTAQVGDVSLWLHGRSGWRQRTGVPKSGLDRNMVDAVLPFTPERVVTELIDVEPGHGIAMMTDGLGDTLSNVASAERYFADRWARPTHLAGFVADLCFDAPGQLDDRTAVVVWCGQNAADVSSVSLRGEESA